VNRDCTIPAGTALFLAIASNGPVDNTGCDATGTVVQRTHFTVDQLRTFADANLDSFLLGPPPRGFLAVDGVEAGNLSGLDPPYRVQSSVFSYTVPALDNLLVLLNGPCYENAPAAELTVDTAVADGVYAMIKPLPVGEHTISFGKEFDGGVRHTYHITVTGGGKSVGPPLRREW
jgi:hypothetical protein